MATKLVEIASNGRLVIPQDARKSLGLREATQLSMTIQDGSIVLTPVAVVPVDHGFPITDALVEAAQRAAAETGPGLSRADLQKRLSARRFRQQS